MNKEIRITIVVFFVFLALIFLFLCGNRQTVDSLYLHAESLAGKSILEEQLKFDAADNSVFEEIKNTKRILSYKISPKVKTYFYQDYYYDTPDLALFNSGCSYRLRTRDENTGDIEYILQFKKEYDTSYDEDFERLEVDSIIPEQTALKVLGREWDDVFADNYDLAAIKELRSFLSMKKIDKRILAPIIYLKQERTRLRLKDRSVYYFEMSLDDCTAGRVGDSEEKQVHFCQLELENKFKGSTSRNEIRIARLIEFFEESYSIKLSKDSKYQKAVKELVKK